MLKTVALVVIINVVSAISHAAPAAMVCKSVGTGRSVTVTLSPSVSGVSEMAVNRTIGTRSFYEKVLVSELPGTRGPVVAYGDALQRKTLVLNLNDRKQGQSLIPGKFTDLSTQEITTVYCR